MDREPQERDEQDEFTNSLTPELRAQEEYLRAQVAAGAPDQRPDTEVRS